jgi:hypothetical protein
MPEKSYESYDSQEESSEDEAHAHDLASVQQEHGAIAVAISARHSFPSVEYQVPLHIDVQRRGVVQGRLFGCSVERYRKQRFWASRKAWGNIGVTRSIRRCGVTFDLLRARGLFVPGLDGGLRLRGATVCRLRIGKHGMSLCNESTGTWTPGDSLRVS